MLSRESKTWSGSAAEGEGVATAVAAWSSGAGTGDEAGRWASIPSTEFLPIGRVRRGEVLSGPRLPDLADTSAASIISPAKRTTIPAGAAAACAVRSGAPAGFGGAAPISPGSGIGRPPLPDQACTARGRQWHGSKPSRKMPARPTGARRARGKQRGCRAATSKRVRRRVPSSVRGRSPAPRRRFQDWSARTPLISRSLLIAIIGGALIGFLTGITMMLAMVPSALVFGFQVWRLVTYAFFDDGMLKLLFVMMSMTTQAPKMEIRAGSAAFFATIV